ncbi:hypothetical protein Tco_0637569 [Tanacetum coccineum]
MLGIWMMTLLLEILWLWEKVSKLIMEDGPRCGMHLNVDKAEFVSLQTKLLRHSGIVASRPAFEDTLCGFPIFYVSKPCSACSTVFSRDIYRDHVVLCVGIIGNKHRHKVVCDILVDVCFRLGISAGKEFDIGLNEECDKPLSDILLYSWDGGLDVCVNLTGSSPLTQTGMVDLVPGRAVIDAAQRKREADAVTLLKRIRKFSMAQDIGARAAVHIFNRISFAIAKGVGAQIVSRLPSNLFRAVIDAAHRKWVKYEAKCANIGYGFLPFSFFSLRELEKDVVTLLKRIRKFFMTQNIGARLDVCMDLTGSSPLTQIGVADFVPGQEMIDVAQRKRDKYMAKCAAIGYGFLPFSFSSLGILEADAVTLLKRIRKFSMAQDIRARAIVHICNRISFDIAKGVGAQIVS